MATKTVYVGEGMVVVGDDGKITADTQTEFLAAMNEQLNKINVIVTDWLKKQVGFEMPQGASIHRVTEQEWNEDTFWVEVNGKQVGEPLHIKWGNYLDD